MSETPVWDHLSASGGYTGCQDSNAGCCKILPPSPSQSEASSQALKTAIFVEWSWSWGSQEVTHNSGGAVSPSWAFVSYWRNSRLRGDFVGRLQPACGCSSYACNVVFISLGEAGAGEGGRWSAWLPYSQMVSVVSCLWTVVSSCEGERSQGWPSHQPWPHDPRRSF